MDAPGEASLLAALRAWGRHSLAYSALQPGMRYFGDAARGYVAYRPCLGHAVVLGDPLCPEAGREALLRHFVESHGRPVFMQVMAPTARILRAMGFLVTPVGVESEIDVLEFGLRGKRKADLRHYLNRAEEGGMTIREMPDTPAVRVALDAVSRAWLRGKSLFSREISFLARPYVAAPEPETRLFAGEAAGETVAFVVLDPMFDQGVRRGYTSAILRYRGDAPEGAIDAINLRVIERLRAEGVPVLSLGVSPFRGIEALARAEGIGARAPYLLFQALRRWGTPIYPFRGLVFHKSRYRAREVPVYVASRGPLGLLPLYAAARACRML